MCSPSVVSYFQITGSGYALDVWKLACFIAWATPFETPCAAYMSLSS